MSKKEKKPVPTYKLVRELFDYRDGVLFWKVAKSRRIKIGDRAGTNDWRGYRKVAITISNRSYRYFEHRLIFLWHHGYWPEHDIDHIDKDRTNNKIENLREASRACNLRNANISIRNKSGVTGVSWLKRRGAWIASIGVTSKPVRCGIYKDFIDAVIARWNAEVEHNYPGCNSTSSAYQYLLKSGEVFFDGNGQAIKRISEAC